MRRICIQTFLKYLLKGAPYAQTNQSNPHAIQYQLKLSYYNYISGQLFLVKVITIDLNISIYISFKF